MNLIIYTQNYPSSSSSEQTFIGRELPYLSEHFEKIVIVPQIFSGEQLPLPSNARVESRFSTFYKKQGVLGIILKALSSLLLYQELLQRPPILLHPQMFLRLVKFVGDAELTKKWVRRWIRDENIDINNTLFYSYWFTQLALGLGLLKQHFPQMKIISRGHGYDIYDERYNPPYWPCRLQALASIDNLTLASEHAKNYMQEKYPDYSFLFETAHLGVEALSFTSKASQDDIFRIVSCSSLVPVKRIDLLVQGISHAAKLHPQQKIVWNHFGNGSQKVSLKKSARKLFPNNVAWSFLGYVPNEKILQFYKENPVDIFINVSESEGVPVTIMEAISCGIPIIATNVGGNSEIVSEENGILLKANPTPNEIAQAFFEMIDNPDLALDKRKGSLKIWRNRYNARDNFEKFARQIVSIINANE